MNILEEAERIIYGDREQTYGKPGVNLDRIAGQWTLYLQQKFGFEVALTAEDVCWLMVDLKKCRQMNADKRDNLVDAAGYLALIERVAEDRDQAEIDAVSDAGIEDFSSTVVVGPECEQDVLDEKAKKLYGKAFNRATTQRFAEACSQFHPMSIGFATICGNCGCTLEAHSPKPPVFPEPLRA